MDAWHGDPKRNEDALSIEPHHALFGIYDGNGKTKRLVLEMLGIEESDWEWAASKLGADYHLPSQLDPDEAAAFVARTLPPLLVDLPPEEAGGGVGAAGKARWAGALRERVCRVHAQMRGQCIMGSASTAVLARLIPSTLPLAMPTLLVVNVGDSRAVLGRSGQAVQVSRDHNADKNLGAADFDAEEVHIHDGRLRVDDEFLVLMSDGVYNAFKEGNDGVVRYVRERLAAREGSASVAAQLVRHARQLEDAVARPESKIDDMSAVVVVLKPTSEAGPLVGWDEEQTWGLSDVVHPGSSSRSRTTTRLVRLLTSIPRWQCALVVAVLVCVALAIGLLVSLPA